MATVHRTALIGELAYPIDVPASQYWIWPICEIVPEGEVLPALPMLPGESRRISRSSVINKTDLVAADTARTRRDVESSIGIDELPPFPLQPRTGQLEVIREAIHSP